MMPLKRGYSIVPENENGVIYDVKGMLDREVIDGRL